MLDLEVPYAVDGPIRSRFRGLSWDKKHQGWRVRIFYSGKQRHVGRYEDELTAAKAYDKAAVYLYGANAITNHGLSQVALDPSQVSAFVVLAKEQADAEQSSPNLSQQRPQVCRAEPNLVEAAQQLPCSTPLPGHLPLQQHACCSLTAPQTMRSQAQLPLVGANTLSWHQQQQLQHLPQQQQQQLLQHLSQQQQQLLQHLPQQQQQHLQQQQQQLWTAGNTMQCMAHDHQQQMWCHSPFMLNKQTDMTTGDGAAFGALGSCMSSSSSATTLSAAAAADTSNVPNPAATASSSTYMLVTAPDGQCVLVPLAAGALGGVPAIPHQAEALAPLQQRLLTVQQGSMAARTQQQQDYHRVMMLNGAASSQPLQPSVQQLPTGIGSYMAAAQMPAWQQQHHHHQQQQQQQPITVGGHMFAAQIPAQQQQQQQQLLAVPLPMGFAPTTPDCNRVPAAFAAGADLAAAGHVSAPATSTGLMMTQTTGAVTNAHRELARSAACAPLTLGGMLQGRDCYPFAAVPTALAPAADCYASPIRHKQQQPQQQLLQQVLQASSRAAGGSLADCSSNSSSSCSPVCGGPASMMCTPGAVATLDMAFKAGRCTTNASWPSSLLLGGAQTVPSPTFSSNSNSSGFGADERLMYLA